MASNLATAQRVSANFSADPANAGSYSQFSRGLVDMDLQAVELPFVNIRTMNPPSALDREGFILADHDVTGDWSNQAWLDEVYVPSCLDLVQRLTHASAVFNLYFPIIRSVNNRDGEAVPAAFLHIDQTRVGYREQAQVLAQAHGREYKGGAVYNVWKAISPPPQDQTLAFLDQRHIDPADLVLGMNVEQGGSGGAPFYGIAPPRVPQPIHGVPDLTARESLVFLAVNMDDDKPLGVAHTSIAPPPSDQAPNPRQSVELRVLALFD